MATRAYILIEISVGKTKEVTRALGQLQGVDSVDMVAGPYDAIAVLEGENLTEIGDLVTRRIQPITGIYRTVVCIA